jgi:hypothetical protein
MVLLRWRFLTLMPLCRLITCCAGDSVEGRNVHQQDISSVQHSVV